MVKEKYNPKKEIEKLSEEHKISIDKTGWEKIEAIDKLNLLHSKLLDFIKTDKQDDILIIEKIGVKVFRDISKKEIEERYLRILEDPTIFKTITEKEFDKEIEGEKKSRKAIFLSLCNVWVKGSEVPLNTFASSETSAGKSFVCKKIIKIFPQELIEYRTKITPEAFTYWHNEEDWDWDGKICYLEDASQAILDSPTFKVMCSEGSTATVVYKQKAIDIEIKGKPVMLVTSARTNPRMEILNRFQIVSLDESERQTEGIVFRKAEEAEAENLINYDEKIINSLRSLKRKIVIIPYAKKIAQFLKENYGFKSLRLRRDFSRLLELIKCSAALHQYQRKEIEEGVIEANEEDYKIARECINYIQTQTFRGLTHRLKKAFDCCKELREFTAKDIHARFPFVNQKMWYLYLDQLSERGMLNTELRHTEEAKQRITFYIVSEDKVFELPEFNCLPHFITQVTTVTNDTKLTKVTKDKNNCKNCNNYNKKVQNNEIDFSKSGIKEELENG